MIDVTYSISQPEFIEAQKMWCSREYKKLPGKTLYQTVSVVFGVFLGLSLPHLPLWLIASVSMCLIALVLVGQWRKNAVREYQFAQNAKQMEGIRVHIDEAGYQDEKADVCGGWISWSNFTGWRESPSIFVLGRNLKFVTIPKAPLSSEQQQELRALLQSHLGASA